ncbi:unnamed protein product [Closterium sp. Yama58-4]|nr:unnamed protein product [Closterium sp. Yama58-4]CAI5478221.1 unnamed protein product [Closterium sp. Yama58-4]CAI5481404.1 unnamed protein product [Closterium sp. Yama58-4]
MPRSLPPFTSPSRCSSLPPPIAFTLPSRRLHFPLLSPSLSPPVALPFSLPSLYSTPSRLLHSPLPSPCSFFRRPLFPVSPCFPSSFSSPCLTLSVSPAHSLPPPPPNPPPTLPQIVGVLAPTRPPPMLPFSPLPPSPFHPRLPPFSCSRWCTCAIGECGAAASPAPLPRCPRLSLPALRQPRLDCPLPPPVHPSPTSLHLSHCPPYHWLPSPLLLIVSLRLISFLLPLLLFLPPRSYRSLWGFNRSSLLPLPSSHLRVPHSPRPLPLALRHTTSSSAPHQPPPHSTPPPRPHTPPCG